MLTDGLRRLRMLRELALRVPASTPWLDRATQRADEVLHRPAGSPRWSAHDDLCAGRELWRALEDAGVNVTSALAA